MNLHSRIVGLCAAAALLAPLAAQAQPLPLPPGVLFHGPPVLVEVEPGIQVVPDYEQEVFFVGGRYYTRHDGRWYRTRGKRWHWRHIDLDLVPPGLRRLQHGHYRHWNPHRPHGVLRPADRPPVLFHGRPTVVEVEPGIMVVPDYDQEVFYVDGRYYLRYESRWYRSRGNRWEWRLIGSDLLPHRLRGLKHGHGHYRHWRRDRQDHDRPGDLHRTDRHDHDRPGDLHRADDRRDRRDDRRDRVDDRRDRRDDHRDRKDDRRDRKDDRKDRRDDRKDKKDDKKDKDRLRHP